MANKQVPPFGVRMPEEVKAWAKDKAKEDGRSVNGLIVHILKKEMVADVSTS